MVWYEDLYIIFEANNDILQYWYIDIIPSLYNVYNDSIIYNYGIVYILQAAFLSALCSECCFQLFCAPDVPEAADNSIFPLSLAFILASGIDKSYLRYGYALWNTMQEVILCKKASEVQNLAPLNFIC